METLIGTYHLGLAAAALLAGTFLVGAASIAVRRRPLDNGRQPRWNRAVAAQGFLAAAIVTWVAPDTRRCVPWLVLAAVLLLVADQPERPHPFGRFTGVATLAGLGGAWLAIPDTEPPLVAAAVLAPLATVQLLRDRAPGPSGTSALVAAIAGSVWVGSAGWGSALAAVVAVGGIGFSPLVIGFGVVLRGRFLAAALALHCAVVLVVPRSVMGSTVRGAWVAVLVASLGLGAALWTIGRWSGTRPGRVGRPGR